MSKENNLKLTIQTIMSVEESKTSDVSDDVKIIKPD